MKKRFKKLLKITIWISGFIIFGMGLYVGYVFSRLNNAIDEKSIEKIVGEINKSKKYNERLYLMYDRIYNNATENSSIKHAWKLLCGKRTECPCFTVANRSYINTRKKLNENEYAIGTRIESHVSQVDCLNYIFETQDYLYNNKGIENACLFYFGKSINQITDDELIGIIVIQENPSFYNPKKFNDRFENKVRKIKKIIEL